MNSIQENQKDQHSISMLDSEHIDEVNLYKLSYTI